MPEIDLCTSRLNKQLHRYVSWMPDPDALYIDAMPIGLENQFVYLFSPFSMIWPILGINKSCCNSSNVTNKIIVQQIVNTSSGAATDYRKQVFATPRYKPKTSLS